MTGQVDANGHASLALSIHNPANNSDQLVTVWIDTAFTGELVIPRSTIESIGLSEMQSISAVLGDGSEIELDTFRGELKWFGATRVVEVIANDGAFPLLGVGLLVGRRLEIDYANRTVALD